MKSNCRWTQLMDEDFLLNHEDGKNGSLENQKSAFYEKKTPL